MIGNVPSPINFLAACAWILLGVLSGTMQGLFFHNEDWLGGYGSWQRRMLRLGHISFFGLAFLDLAFLDSVAYLKLTPEAVRWTARLILVGMVSMPSVCYLSAYNKNFRHLFFIPVGSLLFGIGLFIYEAARR